MAEQHLTKSELAIMEVMWEQEEALTASVIIKLRETLMHD